MTPDDKNLWEWFTKGLTKLQTQSRAAFETPRGRIAIRRVNTHTVLDLHGYTLTAAFNESQRFIDEGRRAGYKYVTIITGLSGPIRAEFRDWMPQFPAVKRIEPLNGGGAFKIFLKKL